MPHVSRARAHTLPPPPPPCADAPRSSTSPAGAPRRCASSPWVASRAAVCTGTAAPQSAAAPTWPRTPPPDTRGVATEDTCHTHTRAEGKLLRCARMPPPHLPLDGCRACRGRQLAAQLALQPLHLVLPRLQLAARQPEARVFNLRSARERQRSAYAATARPCVAACSRQRRACSSSTCGWLCSFTRMMPSTVRRAPSAA
jgi:hypothetical protein